MKKSLLVLSSLILVNCGGNDLLNSQEEIQTPNILNKQSLVQSKISSLENKTETVVMDLSFETGTISEGGGCSFKYALGPNSDIYTSTECYGPNPIYQNGYLVRGYGKPMRASTMRSNPWFGVKLEAKNDPKTVINGGRAELRNDQLSTAISIEFPFQANVTYEISLRTQLTDYIAKVKSPSNGFYVPYADDYDIDKSEAFPTLDLSLADKPDIPGDDPCGSKPSVASGFTEPVNYTRKQKAEKTTQWITEDKNFTFYFSTTQAKNAILIKFLPGITEEINPPHVPQSWFWLDIRNIKIVQKPFDPTYIVKLGGGFRG
jgi:hypothetical protein